MSGHILRSAIEGIKRLQEREVYEENLIDFAEYVWPVVEPAIPMVRGWAMEAICEHLQAVTDGYIRRLLINVPPGFSKPVSTDAWVLEESRGRIHLADVIVGHRILTHRGRYRTVLAVHEQGKIPVLRVKTARGRELVLGPEHSVLTTRCWLQAKELTTDDYLAAVRPQDDSRAPDSVTPEEARLLGYLVGDGCTKYAQITVTNADPSVIADIHKCVNSLGFYSWDKIKPRCKAISVVIKASKERCIGRNPLREWIKRHDLEGKDSYTKLVPSTVMGASDKTIREFLGAYWSCDGFVALRKDTKSPSTKIGCDSVNRKLIEQVQHLLLRLGISSTVYQKNANIVSKRQRSGYRSYLALVEFKDAWKFSLIPMAHTQKMVKAKELSPYYFETMLAEDRVVSVESYGDAVCRCLTVEEDSSFTANDLAVHNSLLTDVFWPAWEWGPRNMPWLRYMCASYSNHLTERDNMRCRNIVVSDRYKSLWGRKFGISNEQFTKIKFANDHTGWKLATSVGGIGIGERADRIIIDDANNPMEMESQIVRDTINMWFTEIIPDRLNNQKESAIVSIQQRTHEDDVSGTALAREMGYVHLCIPMTYVPVHHINGYSLNEEGKEEIKTFIGDDVDEVPPESVFWVDERTDEGELAWPERFPEQICKELERDKGPYAWAGQYQQDPEPRGGSIIKYHYWQKWEGDSYPPFEYILASLDTAFTTKEENDASALTVWGIFRDKNIEEVGAEALWMPRDGVNTARLIDSHPKLMLMYAWEGRLEFSQLFQKVMEICTINNVPKDRPQFQVDKLIIESKANGMSVGHELHRLFRGTGKIGIELINPKRTMDKVARVQSIQHLFADGMIYAPNKAWADKVIKQCALFPKGGHDDLVDSTSQALRYLRDQGFALSRGEYQMEVEEDLAYKSPSSNLPLYQV